MSESVDSLPSAQTEAPMNAPKSAFAMKSPATGAALGDVEATALDGIDAIVGKAREAQVAWGALDIGAERGGFF